jgi:hypothetical protein
VLSASSWRLGTSYCDNYSRIDKGSSSPLLSFAFLPLRVTPPPVSSDPFLSTSLICSVFLVALIIISKGHELDYFLSMLGCVMQSIMHLIAFRERILAMPHLVAVKCVKRNVIKDVY